MSNLRNKKVDTCSIQQSASLTVKHHFDEPIATNKIRFHNLKTKSSKIISISEVDKFATYWWYYSIKHSVCVSVDGWRYIYIS